MMRGTTVQIESLLATWHTGTPDELLYATADRLRLLATKMFRRGHALRRWEQSDDVLQESLVRLHRALRELKPTTAAEFFGLASLQIRRVLIDLSRKHYGALGQGRKHASDDGTGLGNITDESDSSNDWAELHTAVDKLPAELRSVFDLLYYQGMNQSDAASVLGVCERTVKRHWRDARLKLHDLLGGQWPQG
jgi:RNA polymerase sigma factor (sigma-70 family)